MTTAQAAAGSGRVPVRKTTWLAWSLCAVSLALMAFSILLIVLGRSASFPSSPTEWTAASSAEQIASVVGALGAPILGALIAAHRPGNRYGWLWCGIGLASAVNSVAAAYAVYALLVAPDGLPGGLATAWLASCVTWITQGLWPFAFLLFPDGRLPSPRWWPVGWALGLAVAWLTLASALGPGPLESFPFWTNPVMSSAVIPGPIAAAFGDWSWSIYLLSLIFIGPAAVVFRFWRARGQQRQQLKWFAVVGALVLAQVAVTGFVREEQDPLALAIGFAILNWATYAAIGIAVLRHRLYDIDRLLNRTVVYGLLTAILAMGYAASVLILGQLFGQDRSSLAVAGATLAMAAVFQPLRHRLQDAVDRRFNRRRYDAARTIEAFAARLRAQTDLDTLSRELLAVVDQTMEPTTASLWLRPPAKRS
jgi:MFS family permease